MSRNPSTLLIPFGKHYERRSTRSCQSYGSIRSYFQFWGASQASNNSHDTHHIGGRPSHSFSRIIRSLPSPSSLSLSFSPLLPFPPHSFHSHLTPSIPTFHCFSVSSIEHVHLITVLQGLPWHQSPRDDSRRTREHRQIP